MEQVNIFLKEQLEHCRTYQSSLQLEIDYVQKEKLLLSEEVRELSMQLATHQRSLKSSILVEQDASAELNNINRANTILEPCGESSRSNAVKRDGNSLVRNREEDFNSILEFVEKRGIDITYYQTQLNKYDEEVLALQRQVEVSSEERHELQKAYELLNEEQKILSRERDHYESVLKLILKEKQSDEFCLNDLLQTLMMKLNALGSNSEVTNPTPQSASFMEGAIQAVQEQNSNYR